MVPLSTSPTSACLVCGWGGWVGGWVGWGGGGWWWWWVGGWVGGGGWGVGGGPAGRVGYGCLAAGAPPGTAHPGTSCRSRAAARPLTSSAFVLLLCFCCSQQAERCDRTLLLLMVGLDGAKCEYCIGFTFSLPRAGTSVGPGSMRARLRSRAPAAGRCAASCLCAFPAPIPGSHPAPTLSTPWQFRLPQRHWSGSR